jgi:hypothetical protein
MEDFHNMYLGFLFIHGIWICVCARIYFVYRHVSGTYILYIDMYLGHRPICLMAMPAGHGGML